VNGDVRGEAKAGTWVIVADGIHHAGGMDRANAALAEYLCAIGAEVHLVSYRIEPSIMAHPAVTVHAVHTPADSQLLGMWSLDSTGQRVATELKARVPGVRVVVNGSNCDWPDINWIHYVHHAWAGRSDAAPLWYKLKAAIEHRINLNRERKIFPRARILLADSERTRRDLLMHLPLDASRLHTVYYGTDDDWRGLTPLRRATARARLGHPGNLPLVIFVGAMGYDLRKGFDTLWRAWCELCRKPEWDARLIAAGGGRCLASWKQEVETEGLGARVQILGFIDNVQDLLAAADLLVSPVRYEAFGLNVQEALCFGVPAIVSASAGVAEKYPTELKELLICNPDDVQELVAQMRKWRAQMDRFKRLTGAVAEQFRSYSWRDMAAQIVALAEAGVATRAGN
jgi:glycosyltransferase involved in cell wall biosynthesis